MDYTSPVIEALAHYVRGAATLFFVLWALRILPFARSNRMVRRLYWCTLFMAFNYSVDAALMIFFHERVTWMRVAMHVADVVSVPLVCAYSLEMLRFLGVRNCQSGVCQHGSVQHSGGLCRTLCRFLSRIDFCSGLVAQMCYVCCSGCHNRCEHARRHVGGHFYVNRSCGVSILAACIAYIFITLFYVLASGWLALFGEVVYDVSVVLIWSFLYVCARRYGEGPRSGGEHAVRSQASEVSSVAVQAAAVSGKNVPGETVSEEICLGEYSCQFEQKLSQAMNVGKLYLNPKLTLLDVALAIGSNRTYVSDYLNKVMHTTFYDYVNRLRVEESCGIIDGMPLGGRRNMPEVAQMSGFNSLATFNRSFKAVKGMTPKKYYQQVMGTAADDNSAADSGGSESI